MGIFTVLSFIKNEYEVRFGVVMLLDFYIENGYISKVLTLLDNTKHNGFTQNGYCLGGVHLLYKVPRFNIGLFKT